MLEGLDDAIDTIKKVFNVYDKDIKIIELLKKGITNSSFLFECNNEEYIFRMPGKGTDKLINRKNEAQVYSIINGKNICEEVIYIDPESGYKITRYIKNAQNCDSNNQEQIKKCMKKLRDFHSLNLQVSHKCDIFEIINTYEKLWNHKESKYLDYKETKKNIFSLKPYIDKHINQTCLTHLDANPDNFLLFKSNTGNEEIRIIDWEYSSMQDPHVDIALFCTLAQYDKKQVDNVIDYYFTEECPKEIRIKIYCYVALCGLWTSNWCEYKEGFGMDYGEFSTGQYRYAIDYYEIVKKNLAN